MINFEFSKIDDIERVMAIDNQYEFEKYSRANFEEFYSNKYVEIVIATIDGIDVGYVILLTIFDESNLVKIVVNKEYRNSSIGSQLLDYVKNYLNSKGVKKIFLEVRVDNLIAKSFYKKNGFVEGGVRKGYYNGIDGNIYWYRL